MEIGKIREIVAKVDGWLTDAEGELLYNFAKGCSGKGVIVEIGSWKGKSTIWLGKGSQAGKNSRIYAIDPHIGSSEHKKSFGKVWTFEEFKKNIKNAKVDNLVTPIVKTSEDAAKHWKGQPIELLWIDGAHEYELVLLDYKLWEPHLADGGIIAFHDTVSEGPKKVVSKYLYKGSKFRDVGFVDGITYGTKCKKLTAGDRIKNRYVFFLRTIYLLAARFRLPKPIIAIGKKIAGILQ